MLTLEDDEAKVLLSFGCLTAFVLCLFMLLIYSSYVHECKKQERMAAEGLVQQPTTIGPMWIPREYYQHKVLAP